MLKKTDKILIAGQEGLVGSAIYRILKKNNYKIIECRRKDLDFTNYKKVFSFFKKKKPKIVINAAGKVGGILDNSKYPIEYLNTNIMIGLNLINISYKLNIKKLINFGSACIYPKKTKLPIKEDYLLAGYLEKTNEAYAIAKIVSLKLCEYYNKIKKKDFISVQPANLYGLEDNYNLSSSHVIPALIRKFFEGKINKKKYVKIWGDGKNTREFLHVDDLAKAILFLLKNKRIKNTFVNIGSGEEISIIKLARLIKKVSKFNGKIVFEKNKPSGQKRRVLDSSIINNLGWRKKIKLENGIAKLYHDYVKINSQE